jgi:hypothetical protein
MKRGEIERAADARRRHRRAAARRRRAGRRSTCCGGCGRWRSPAGMHVFPGGSVDPADAHASLAWSGPARRRVRRGASRATSRWPARWSAPPCGRPSRSRASCSPGRPGRGAGRRQHRRVGGRAGRAGGARAVAVGPARPPRAGPAGRPAAPVRALDHPEVEDKRFDTRFFVARVPAGAGLPRGRHARPTGGCGCGRRRRSTAARDAARRRPSRSPTSPRTRTSRARWPPRATIRPVLPKLVVG